MRISLLSEELVIDRLCHPVANEPGRRERDANLGFNRHQALEQIHRAVPVAAPRCPIPPLPTTRESVVSPTKISCPSHRGPPCAGTRPLRLAWCPTPAGSAGTVGAAVERLVACAPGVP